MSTFLLSYFSTLFHFIWILQLLSLSFFLADGKSCGLDAKKKESHDVTRRTPQAEGEGFKPPIPERGIPDFESSAIDHSANLPDFFKELTTLP